jgi:citrate lyase subunit beta / citryl-CoA lyase
MEGVSGNRGPSVRSDCYVRVCFDNASGITLNLKSKVQSLYGRHIRELVYDILNYFGIRDISVDIEDSGALPYVIAARLESAIKKVIACDKEYLLPEIPRNRKETSPFNSRRSRLYLPGNHPKLMINAGLYNADGLILDLEDSVASDKKHEARFLVRNALRTNDFMGAEIMVRINQLPAGLDDLPFVVPHPVNVILIPKCESAADVLEVNSGICRINKDNTRKIWLMPIIESAKGLMKAYEIASAADSVVALAIGLEDYTTDIGAQRTDEGIESTFARSVVINAARAAGIQPIDSVFSRFEDTEVIRKVAESSKSMGFQGMGCIHPAQVAIVNQAFNPSSGEIEKAMRIVVAYETARKMGLGVVAADSAMIDAPVARRALNVLKEAEKFGLLQPDWRESHG